MERAQEIFADIIGQKWIMQLDFRNPRNGTEEDVFKARLGGCCHGNCVAIAPQAGSYPQNIDLGDRFGICGNRHAAATLPRDFLKHFVITFFRALCLLCKSRSRQYPRRNYPSWVQGEAHAALHIETPGRTRRPRQSPLGEANSHRTGYAERKTVSVLLPQVLRLAQTTSKAVSGAILIPNQSSSV
jgi:hypothetical protein